MYLRKNSMVTEGYKKLIFGFVVVTIALLALVLFFSAGRAVIKVIPRASPVETDVIVDVATDGGGNGDYLQGILFETEAQGKGEGTATGTELLSGGTIGKVTLINKRAEAQTLVKTTRLLSQDNVLLRLSDRIIIPASGQIEASVYADNPNAFTELQPTTFKIPGLWEGLQDKVYAESKSVIKSTGQSVKIIKAADIAAAKSALTEKLYEQAINEFKKQLPNTNYASLVVSKKILEESASASAGDKQDKFEVSMKLDVIIVGLSQDKVVELAANRLKSALNAGQELSDMDLKNFAYSVQSFNNEKKTVDVKIKAKGAAVVKADNPIFDRDKLSDLSPKGVEMYLANFEEVEGVEVALSPFWVKKVPSSKERIEIIVVNPQK
ncbi:hypothetical protein HZB94_03345 [Candidatus Falkowbacteria bacterium]|nr:hypothetical protein [Candidatus Falkowbacteria bacterium]